MERGISSSLLKFTSALAEGGQLGINDWRISENEWCVHITLSSLRRRFSYTSGCILNHIAILAIII